MQHREKIPKRIIVTGGGSGGHISTAQALIKALEEKYDINNNNFLYIGGDLGMVGEEIGNSLEMKIFGKEIFNKKYIRAGKLQRSLEIGSIKLFFRTFLGILDSYKIIKEFKPEILISTGGFVSVPVSIIAKLFKTKIYLHEQTAATGLANKIVSRFAEKIFVTFPSSENYFPKDKVIHTGNLVRKDIFKEDGKGNLVEKLKSMIAEQEKYPIIYISGGSLGSHLINSTVKDSMKMLADNFQVIIQTGDNKSLHDYEDLLLEQKKLDKNIRSHIHIVKYVDNEEIGFLFKNIDLFVGRAGANTVYEMGLLQIPSIFVPIPWVTHDEQRKNAQILKDLGFAMIIEEGELIGDTLVHKINSFLKKDKIVNSEESKIIFTKDASERILKYIGI